MTFGYVVVAILAAAIAIFALENRTPTDVQFLGWALRGVPVSVVILLSLAAGLIVAGLPLWLQRWRLRSRVRALDARVKALEAGAAERHPIGRGDRAAPESPLPRD